jgi:L-fucose isomerase-like protein
MARIGLLALARPTFDVPFAEELAGAARTELEHAGHVLIGSPALLLDDNAAHAAMAALQDETFDLLLVLQATFADASMILRIAESARAPLAIWAFPEPRSGGRLRLNSFCGLNLAVHALGRAEKPVRWLYASPGSDSTKAALDDMLAGRAASAAVPSSTATVSDSDRQQARRILGVLERSRIGLVGEHPVGFDTCRYDAVELRDLVGIEVERVSLPELFARAEATPGARIAETKRSLGRRIAGLDAVDQPQLERSLSVLHALEELSREERLAALAVRCWPEMFTEYGCAACGPMALMNQAKVPCACEADMYGALTALALQEIAGEPSFLVDIVDMDRASDTGVLWHCGLAPMTMADLTTPPTAQIHSNRRMPLLLEFALKPGRVTAARFSQARSRTSLVLAGGEMVAAPKSFTGTSGVMRFDRPVGDVTAAMLDMGLEHHVAIVYGDVRGPLRALGEAMDLPVYELA